MMIEGLRGAWANKCIPEAASALDWIATPPPLSENLHNSRRQAQAAKSTTTTWIGARLLTASAAAKYSQMTCCGGALQVEEEAGEL